MLVAETHNFSVFRRITCTGPDEFFLYKSTEDKNFMLEQLAGPHSEQELVSLHKCLTQFIKAREKAAKATTPKKGDYHE